MQGQTGVIRGSPLQEIRVTHNKYVNLFDLFVFLVVCLSFTSILLLVLNSFNPYYAVCSGVALAGVSAKLLRLKTDLSFRGFPLALGIILLGSLVFRVPPYLFVPGGQDQGIYVNMSATYEKHGSTFIIDEVRKKAIESGLKDWYDAGNQVRWRDVEKGEYEGEHLPGIYIKDSTKSEYVYQFYPLHPLWMALAGKFFGEKNRVYSLVFFSLLSITAFYLLASVIPGGSKTSSVLIGIFLALNPLHAYFSKFPVTEVVALAFSSLGFYYLVRYYERALAGEMRGIFLILSAGLFGCMFFTRISGFMYTPLFYFFLLLTLVFEGNLAVRKQLGLFFLAIFALYTLSVAYGMAYSYPYSQDIYQRLFSNFLGSLWQCKLMWACITAGIILIITSLMRKRVCKVFEQNVILARVKTNINMLLCLLFGIIIIMACYRGYQLGFTDQYAGGRYDIGGHGWQSLAFSNIFVVMMYLSPVAFWIFLYGMVGFLPQRRGISWTSFLTFLILFWYAFTVIMFLTHYQYYYARYLLSEVVPYTLLAVCLILGYLFQKGRLGKVISVCLSTFIACFFMYFTGYQFMGKSADGAYASLKEIEESVKKDDLLVLCGIGPPLQWVIGTPLSSFYNLNTCTLKNVTDLQTMKGKRFVDKFNDLFVLSKDRLQFQFLTPLKEIKYKQGGFVKARSIPKEYRYNYETLNFYKIVKSDLTSNIIYPMEMKDDLIHFYDDLWTDGNGIIRNIRHKLKPNDRYICINTKGLNPFIHDNEWPKPELYIDGIRQAFYSKSRNSFTFRISRDIRVIREIRIVSATFIPKEAGINEDKRRLGIDVASIIITDKSLDNRINPRQMKGDLSNFCDGYFTNGNGIIRNINYELRPKDRYISINTNGWNPFIHDPKWPMPELYLNGIKQGFYRKSKLSYIYRISNNISVIREIRIVSETFVPKELGLGEDGRRLGLDISSIVISENPDGS